MWTPAYYIHYVELPASVEGITVPNDDGTFDIYINVILPTEKQEAAARHELEHIRRDHMYDDVRPVTDLENEADTIILNTSA